MKTEFSKRMKEAFNYVREEVIRLGDNTIGIEHLFLGIIREGNGSAIKILKEIGLDPKQLRIIIENKIPKKNSIVGIDKDTIQFKKQTERVLKKSLMEQKNLNENEIKTIHVLLAILLDDNNIVSLSFEQLNINYETVIEEYERYLDHNISAEIEGEAEENDDDIFGSSSQKPKSSTSKSATPVLDNFGRDLTQYAIEDKLDPIVGRIKEIERVSQILSRRKKNNPILVGEPGVGKSAIAEGLALRIVQKKVSRVLFNKRVVMLDLAALVAGTKYRGQFEERMKGIIGELEKNPEIILFIDEIHTLVGAGGATGSLDASNMFKPALARGELQCIGATTLDEYRQHIEKDGALERRFQKVLVNPTSIDETIEILNNIKVKYEEHHNVKYTEDAIKSCVILTDRYMNDRFLPDKAIDALDEAGSRVHITNIKAPNYIKDIEDKLNLTTKEKKAAIKKQKFELAAELRDEEKQLQSQLEFSNIKWEKDLQKNKQIVSENNVADVVSIMTGIPVNKVASKEMKKLSLMSDNIKKKIIGQDEAIEKVVRAIRRNRIGLKDPGKPIGSFIFLGSTGVGKTQLTKALSEEIFDSSEALIRVDMSEYMEKFAVSRLVGSPPGYIGYEEGGQLTEQVRRKPYSVILLDEIEKAHPDVFNLLLQALDDGQMTDSLGRKISFKNTIIIMTSNIGARELKDFGQGIGFNTTAKIDNAKDHNNSIIEKALKRAFSPEFLNRIDEIILFHRLLRRHMNDILQIQLASLNKLLEDKAICLILDDKAQAWLANSGYDPVYGARPLKRVMQKNLQDFLAELLLKGSINENDKVQITADKSGLIVNGEKVNKVYAED